MNNDDLIKTLNELLVCYCADECCNFDGLCNKCKYKHAIEVVEKMSEAIDIAYQWIILFHITPEHLQELKNQLKEGNNDQGRNQTT